MPHEFIDKFTNGFPVDWKKTINEFIDFLYASLALNILCFFPDFNTQADNAAMYPKLKKLNNVAQNVNLEFLLINDIQSQDLRREWPVYLH